MYQNGGQLFWLADSGQPVTFNLKSLVNFTTMFLHQKWPAAKVPASGMCEAAGVVLSSCPDSGKLPFSSASFLTTWALPIFVQMPLGFSAAATKSRERTGTCSPCAGDSCFPPGSGVSYQKGPEAGGKLPGCYSSDPRVPSPDTPSGHSSGLLHRRQARQLSS